MENISSVLMQNEATQNQYIFNFLLMNIIFILGYLYRMRTNVSKFTVVLILIFLLYAFWDTDYFSMKKNFYEGLRDFRDPLYYYISLMSFKSYIIFRLFVWGSAYLLFCKTINNFKLPQNYSNFIFTIFFLLTFSYARVSLGMALYFYGVSRLLMVGKNSRIFEFIVGILFILLSYLGHRSMLVLILLTPLVFVELNRKTIAIYVAASVIFSALAQSFLSRFASGDVLMHSQFSGFMEAATKIAGNDSVMEYNWKFALMRNLRNYSFIITMMFFIWKIVLTQKIKLVAPYIKRLLSLCCGVFIIALSYMSMPGLGAEIIGYRYLYMLGIPFCLILSYLVSEGIIKPCISILLLLPAFLYAEGFIFGKILSF